mmetsp:Transcript_28761/g.66397  ORF Transcript_28761/g.66397 Transcript_28761/m.66397 type:complete len:293 (-) Transcript_28761:17-895(-)
MVDSAHVVFEVRVHIESCLHGPMGHDRSSNSVSVGVESLHLAGERVAVFGKVVVGSLGRIVTMSRALGRLGHGRAARLAFGGVGIKPLRSVVVAVGKREIGAEAQVCERSGVVVLAPSRKTLGLDVVPSRLQLPAIAAILLSTEARLLSRQRHGHVSISGNAQPVGGGLRAAKGPAATAVALVTNISNDLGALGPVLLGVEACGDHQIFTLRNEPNLAGVHKGTETGLPTRLDAAEILGRADGQTRETRVDPSLPKNAWGGVDLFNLTSTLCVMIDGSANGQKRQGKHKLHS